MYVFTEVYNNIEQSRSLSVFPFIRKRKCKNVFFSQFILNVYISMYLSEYTFNDRLCSQCNDESRNFHSDYRLKLTSIVSTILFNEF